MIPAPGALASWSAALASAAPADSSDATPPLSPDDEPDPEEASDPPFVAPAPLDARWDVPPRPATAALAAAHEAQSGKLSGYGVREISGKDLFDIEWTPAARPVLRRMKETAVAVVEARLAEAAEIARGEPLPEHLEPFFSRAFLDQKPADERELRGPVASARSWLGGRVFGVVLSFPMTGGSDDVLALFEREGAGFRRVMVVARHDYASILQGQLALDYAVRPVGSGYHVMTTHSSPWISSLWRGAHLRIFEPGPSPTQPRLLLDEPNSARITEHGADLSADDRGFAARFLSWAILSAPEGDAARLQVHRFAFEGGQYRRVAPFVTRVRDLPDEWVKLPWSVAQTFTAEASRARLAPVHRRLSRAAEHLALRGRMLRKTVGDRVQLRLLPDRDHAPIVFVVEGRGEDSKIAEVIEE
jgi:hypothetical protein